MLMSHRRAIWGGVHSQQQMPDDENPADPPPELAADRRAPDSDNPVPLSKTQPAQERPGADPRSPPVEGGLPAPRPRGPGRRRGLLLALVLAALLLVPADTLHPTPPRAVASADLFSLIGWEAANLLAKWPHLFWATLAGSMPPREERLALVEEYLTVARMAGKEQDRLEGPRRGGGSTVAVGGARQAAATSREYLNELLRNRKRLRARAEEAIEAELSAVLGQQGMDSRLRMLFPPVDLRFGEPPTALITSPRDRIQRLEAVLLTPDLKVLERDRLEKELLADHDLSGLVSNLAGLSTYPTLVSDMSTLRDVLQTAAHEWLHAYFFFRPFGWNYFASQEMSTLNETAADLAGRELGDMTFASMGGDLTVSASRYLPTEERFPVFTREMRKTRVHVDELLSEGKVEEAEQYMKERWWFLALRGFRLRKLNQAYFAFHGSYSESPASVSPIGDQLKELRSLFPDVGSFVRAVAGLGSYGEFLDTLESLKAEAGGSP